MITVGKKKYNTFEVTFLGDTYELYFVTEKYADNHTLAVEAWDAATGEPFATLTVNLRDPRQARQNHAFFDVNNCTEDLLRQLTELGLIERTKDGYRRQSGYAVYPLCKFNVKKFRTGRPGKKYWVDYSHYTPEGKCVGSMSWEFEEKEFTECESLDEAKDKARELIRNLEYYEEDGIDVLEVIDRREKVFFTVANSDKEAADRLGVKADEYADVKPANN